MIIDGNAIAGEIYAATREKIAGLGRIPKVRAITVSPNEATESYLRKKTARAKDAGMELEVIRLESGATDDDVVRAIDARGADAIIVQLPLPPSFDTEAILDHIPVGKDADVLSRAAYTRFSEGAEGALVPPVAAAIGFILEQSGIDSFSGKQAVVVGSGKLVGKPAAIWLTHHGANVTVADRADASLAVLKDADIIVSGAGKGGLIAPAHIREGVVLIDAGTSESGGAIVGDADPACALKAGVFTPVPGGVGPIAVACLFANAAQLLTVSG